MRSAGRSGTWIETGAASTRGRAFRWRRIVGAVSGHGHDLPVRLDRPNHRQLLLGPHAGEDAHLPYDRPELLVICRLEILRFGGRQRPPPRQAQLARDGDSRGRLVPGDHDRPDPGRVEALDRVRHLAPDRVHEPDQPEQGEPGFEVVLPVGLR